FAGARAGTHRRRTHGLGVRLPLRRRRSRVAVYDDGYRRGLHRITARCRLRVQRTVFGRVACLAAGVDVRHRQQSLRRDSSLTLAGPTMIAESIGSTEPRNRMGSQEIAVMAIRALMIFKPA